MPFTLSHPAIAIPFARYRFPLSALVIGSMAPDFPYFLQLSTHHQFGHTLPGVVLFCLPAGLVALCLFHAVLKKPLLTLFPLSHQERLEPFAEKFRVKSGKEFCRVVIALLIGTLTHLVWDSFTHAGGWTVRHCPLLRQPLFATSHNTVCIFKTLQHGSTIFGALMIAWMYFRWLKQTPLPLVATSHQTLSPRLLIGAFAGTALVAFCASFMRLTQMVATQRSHNAWQPESFVRNTVISTVALWSMECLLWSLLWHWKRKA